MQCRTIIRFLTAKGKRYRPPPPPPPHPPPEHPPPPDPERDGGAQAVAAQELNPPKSAARKRPPEYHDGLYRVMSVRRRILSSHSFSNPNNTA